MLDSIYSAPPKVVINQVEFLPEEILFISFYNNNMIMDIAFAKEHLTTLKIESAINLNKFLEIELYDFNGILIFSKTSNDDYIYSLHYDPQDGFRKQISQIKYY